MCGRYSLVAEIGELAVRLEFDAHSLTQAARYNIAPTQMVLAVRSSEGNLRTTALDASPLGRIVGVAEPVYHLAATASAAA